MKISIMQPYFFPYVVYYKLLAQADKFVIYDDIQFTKKGWINRNYLNSKSGPWLFSVPVLNSSAIETIGKKRIAPEFNRAKFISRIEQNYYKFTTLDKLSVVKKIINFDSDNLFEYIHNSLYEISGELEIDPEKIVRSSSLGSFVDYKGQDKVIQICKKLKADVYVNPISGKALYSENIFEKHGIKLTFQDPIATKSQNEKEGIPYFSFLHNYLITSYDKLRNEILN